MLEISDCRTALKIIRALQTGFVPLVVFVVVVAVVWSILTAGRRPLRAIVVPAICAIFIRYMLLVLPLFVEDSLNRSYAGISTKYAQNTSGTDSSSRFRVADLHCDVLLWARRDFTRVTKHPWNSQRVIGHVDIPRLRKGNVRLQVFAVSYSDDE